MNTPFVQILKITFRHRWAIAGLFATSLMIAVLWSTNISAVLPMVDVIFQGDNLTDYVENQLTSLQTELAENQAQSSALIEIETSEVNDQLWRLEQRQETLQSQQQWYQAALPYVQQYTPGTPFGTLLLVLGFLVVGTGLKLLALAANLMLVHFVAGRSAVTLREQFFRKALHLDMESFGENGSADLTARLTNDVSLITGGITTLLGRMVREPLKMIACFVGAAIICPRLLLLIMVVLPVLAVIMQYLSRSIRRASRRAMEEMSKLYGVLNDSFAGIRMVKVSNTHASERARLHRSTMRYFVQSVKMTFYNTMARATTEMLGITTVSLGILAGGYLVLNQQTHLFGIQITSEPLGQGQIFLFFGFLIGAADPARKLADVWSSLQSGIAASTRVMEVIDAPIRVTEPEHPRTTARPHREIVFKDVHYQYPSGPKVLQGIDLSIQHGTNVAIVGPNGCGKSTLLNLLCRFDDPQSGAVCLDDVPLDQMRPRDLRKRIALVTQRSILFDDTIENNIRYGCPGATREQVIAAAKLAFADDFISEKTRDGYDTRLGSSGVRLSGGQMQRIALARAFLRDPDILILDEATSQVDSESEQLIHQALKTFLVGRTCIMITHRPSCLDLADQIVVMSHGQVEASGHHETVLQSNDFYRTICGSEWSVTPKAA